MKRIFLSMLVLLLFVKPASVISLYPTIESYHDNGSGISFEGVLNHESYVLNELLVAFKEDTHVAIVPSASGGVTRGIASIDQLNRRYQLVSAEQLIKGAAPVELSNIYLLRFANGTDVSTFIKEYGADESVEIAELNYLYTPCHIPNDPYFTLQWSLQNTGQTGGTAGADISATVAWDLEQGDPNITIAILDTGVDYTNPDIGKCTDGLTEVNYSLESPHPLNETFSADLNFPCYDTVSFHIIRFDTESDPGFLIQDLNKQSKEEVLMFSGVPYNGTGSNLWTRFSESNTLITLTANQSTTSGEHWGFMIDKLKASIWTPLSEQSIKFIDGYDFNFNDPDPMDNFGHGTHCAGIASAVTDNGYGIAGIAGGCRIMPIRIGSANTLRLSAMIQGIKFAVDNGARVLSMSYGGPRSSLKDRMFNYAESHNVVLVAAAGNSNWNCKTLSSPAEYHTVIAVAATDANDARAYFTNYGSWVDVAAPGIGILSLRAHGTDMYEYYQPTQSFIPPYDSNATLCYASGTSMSCPIVAGVVGLVLSKQPSLTPAQVRTIIRSSTDPVSSSLYIGTGRINAYIALQKTAPVIAEFNHTLDDLVVSTGSVTLSGIAEGEQFCSYSVDYAAGIYPANDSWVLLSSSTSPHQGALASLNTSILEEGLYTIRLRVTANGQTYQDIVVLVVDNKPNTYIVDCRNIDGPWLGTEEHPFTSIQYAMECCGTQGDTVHVARGVYSEAVNIINDQTSPTITYKNVTVHGEGKNCTILDGKKHLGYGLNLINAYDAQFTGFTVTNYMDAVLCFNSYNNIISENTFQNPFVIGFSKNNWIFRNNFLSADDNIITMGRNLWYDPVTRQGNYWSDYQERYPNAQPRVFSPWAWNTPYKVNGLLNDEFPFSLLVRLTPNTDRYPLLTPT